MKTTLCWIVWSVSLLLGQAAYGASVCPTTIENDPPATADGCGLLLTVGSNLHVAISLTGTGAYDGASSSTFGVINSSGASLSSLSLATGGGLITLFAGDGIREYVPANDIAIPPPLTIVDGYEDYYGPQTTFSNVDYASDSLTVDFTGALMRNAATYFSLPGDPQADYAALTGAGGSITASGTSPVPDIPIASMLAVGAIVLVLSNKLQEAGVKRRTESTRSTGLSSCATACGAGKPLRAATSRL